ncbi:hypothetical protein [Bacillus sp. FJAT-50079]|uniref:hypothetical protein n=1 Tax=Bacillus sp. FJAT-50079 TaxID=2833577 RepID=UPI001BC9547D|nr:hypothetical protein [Bacillus sp. FJAT-50079]MBS4208033.1 hypothetical protein [Bacillus sp. FJAT-50079]
MGVELHFPDLEFVRKTKERFNVNRGIYNTIDAWFYTNGFDHIVDRRRHIIMFLVYAQKTAKNQLLFPNGLTAKLEEYVYSQKKNRVGLLDN